MDPYTLTSLIGLGLLGYFIGFIGGMVGLVLGVLRLPIVYFYAFSPSVAAGTNIGVSAMGAIAGSARHIREGRINYRVLTVMAVSAALGAFIGGYYGWVVPPWILLLMIGLIVLYEGATLSRTPKPEPSNTIEFAVAKDVEVDWQRVVKEAIMGFSIGILGGMVGLVLGSIRLPAMLRILKMEPKMAVGTNLAVSSVMGVSGFMGHIFFGQIHWGILVSMGIAAVIGGYMGAKYTGRLETHKLKRLIGYILLIICIAFFWESYNSSK